VAAADAAKKGRGCRVSPHLPERTKHTSSRTEGAPRRTLLVSQGMIPLRVEHVHDARSARAGPGRRPLTLPKHPRPASSWWPKLRLRFLGRLADGDSWRRARELYAEMQAKGLSLPAAETLELLEVGPLSLSCALWICY
jgi:hypothetical protein